LALEPHEGAGDCPLLKIPISDAFDKYAELAPFLSSEIMIIWAALATPYFEVKLNARLLIISALGATVRMTGEVTVFLAGFEFESWLLAQVLGRNGCFLSVGVLATTNAT
jgi:hypothetical protein